MKKYCLDANVLIEPWNKHFTMVRAPQYWKLLDDLAKREEAFCTMEVRREIEKKNEGLYAWVKAHKHLFREIDDEVQYHLREIMRKFPRLVDSCKFRSPADPWVIAHAMAEKAVVVTKEQLELHNPQNKPKIPNVCDVFGIEWMDEFKLLDELGFSFH
jgi:hypothetical protein